MKKNENENSRDTVPLGREEKTRKAKTMAGLNISMYEYTRTSLQTITG